MNKFLIDNKSKIKEALEKFNKISGKSLYVVKKNKFLVGSLTDGDWRRESLKGKKIYNTVESVCNKSPITVKKTTPLNIVKKIIKSNFLTSVPVVDNKNHLLKIIFKNDILKKKIIYKKKNSTPIVIMAGGKGTRLTPFTQVLPKPLIPIRGKTIISRILESFILRGFNNFYISINEKSKIIKSYFEEKNLKKKITFVEENKPLGTAGALSKLINIKDKILFVTNCDTFINYDYNKITKHHILNKNSLTMLVVKKQYKIPYGICKKNNNNELTNMIEKPELDYLINIGSYVINKSEFKLLKKNAYCDFNNFIKVLQKNNKRIGLYQISEKKWKDTGTWDEYKRTVALMN
jgi:dTDP-glucose pyrophosphorylase